MLYQSQRDSRWANHKLGFSNETIGNFGCVITCLANLFEITPLQMNEWMKNNGAFVNQNLTYWAKIPGFIYRGWSYNNDEVKKAISQYGAVIVEVDFDNNPRTDLSHYVIFIGNQKLFDVWDGKEKPTSIYSILKGYVVYDIEKAKAYFKNQFSNSQDNYYKGIDMNNKESVKVCIDEWKRVVDGYYVKKEEYEAKIKELNDKYQREIDDKEKTIINLNTQIDNLTKQNLQLIKDNEMLNDYKNKYSEFGKQLEELTKEHTQLKIDFGNAKEEWVIKEQGYLKQIKTLQTKYEATKSPLKKLLIDYIYGKTQIKS
jgi:hypothetical protein